MDIEYRLGSFRPGELNRAGNYTVSAGGKGINVSRAIMTCAKRDGNRFPFRLRTVAPVGGATGETFRKILEDEGISTRYFVGIEGSTRVNVSLIAEDGGQTEINAPGPPVGDKLGEIEAAALAEIGPGDVVLIAGSCPKDVPKSYPSELVGKIREKGAAAVLDCDGEALRIAVNAPVKPDIIKPNREELAALCGTGTDGASLVRAAESLDIPTVLTTLAGDGCLLKDVGNPPFFMETVKRPVVRLKGAGDTFLGAYLYARFVCSHPYPESAVEYAMSIAGDYVAGE